MKMLRAPRNAGVSLIETMVATIVIGMVAAGLAVGLTSLQRNFAATKDYATNHGDELRISDYIALDLRRALTVVISGTGSSTRVTLTIPNYYGPGGVPRTPVINADGTVDYRDTSIIPVSTVTIIYYLSGGSMIREESGVPQTLAVNVRDFQLTVTDSATTANAVEIFNLPVSLGGKVAQVKTQISFSPTFRSGGASSSAAKATTFYNTTLLRNARRDQGGLGLY